MPLIELTSPEAVGSFITTNHAAIVTFSAHWCGPCNQSKPALERLAAETSLPMAIAYENNLGDALHNMYYVRAFPTYVLYVDSYEKKRVEGANMAAVQALIAEAPVTSSLPVTGGETLGGGGGGSAGGGVALSPEEARAARLAKLGGAAASAVPVTTEPQPPTSLPVPLPDADTIKAIEESKAVAADDDNVADTNVVREEDTKVEDDTSPSPPETLVDPTADLDPTMIDALTQEMGFSLIRAQKGLLYGGKTVEGAIEWLTEHQEDDDIDDPILPTAPVAQSYKCNECGKILSNMANLELHANKTGHSDFEESTASVKPMTEEEKKAKIAEIKQLLKAKRAEREEAEKADEVEREKQRRFMAKEMAKTREEMEKEQRKRDALDRKREKEEQRKERARIKAELEKDKLERRANKGKLSSKLGVEGYHPDAIQYDVDMEEVEHHEKKKPQADVSKIDDYIKKVSSYRAGGDGGKCLKMLKVCVGNVVENPKEDKYKRISMESNAFKTKIKPFLGAKQLLMAVGFAPTDEGDALVLREDADLDLLSSTKTKLEDALVSYG